MVCAGGVGAGLDELCAFSWKRIFAPPPITTKHTEDEKWCRESGPLLGSSPIRSKLDHPIIIGGNFGRGDDTGEVFCEGKVAQVYYIF